MPRWILFSPPLRWIARLGAWLTMKQATVVWDEIISDAEARSSRE